MSNRDALINVLDTGVEVLRACDKLRGLTAAGDSCGLLPNTPGLMGRQIREEFNAFPAAFLKFMEHLDDAEIVVFGACAGLREGSLSLCGYDNTLAIRIVRSVVDGVSRWAGVAIKQDTDEEVFRTLKLCFSEKITQADLSKLTAEFKWEVEKAFVDVVKLEDGKTLLEVRESVADAEATPDPPVTSGPKKPSVNVRMLEAVQANLGKVGGWTAKQWAGHLKCAQSTVVATATWKDLMMARLRLKTDHAKSKRRKPKASDQQRD